MKHSALKSDVWLILVTLFAGFGWVFSAEALVGMTPLLFIGTRFLLAGFILIGFGWGALHKLSRQDWRHALLTGAVMGLALSCWIMGLALADNMGIGAFIASLAVVFVPIVGKLLFGASTSLSTWVAIAVALVGLAFLRLEEGLSLSASDAFFLMAALGFSVHFNLNTRFASSIPALPLTALQLLGCCLIFSALLVSRWRVLFRRSRMAG
ncbi:MAG: DMT family transporter [Natronospirillum sp.]|uniref:DMT family transporter n=1 Tax=Natronospirillum sp. TaxID=2812955 RepID=UPI0025D52EB5|nr:DMT family transporter [Natronospirillum sp.]MCH8553324.1 DMT family transporter [Natronospirillum sp.]